MKDLKYFIDQRLRKIMDHGSAMAHKYLVKVFSGAWSSKGYYNPSPPQPLLHTPLTTFSLK